MFLLFNTFYILPKTTYTLVSADVKLSEQINHPWEKKKKKRNTFPGSVWSNCAWSRGDVVLWVSSSPSEWKGILNLPPAENRGKMLMYP